MDKTNRQKQIEKDIEKERESEREGVSEGQNEELMKTRKEALV